MARGINYSADAGRRLSATYFATLVLANAYARKPILIVSQVYDICVGRGGLAMPRWGCLSSAQVPSGYCWRCASGTLMAVVVERSSRPRSERGRGNASRSVTNKQTKVCRCPGERPRGRLRWTGTMRVMIRAWGRSIDCQQELADGHIRSGNRLGDAEAD
jgi:hypothetical protein